MRTLSPLKPRGAFWRPTFASPIVRIADVECRPHDVCCTEEFCFHVHRLIFVRRGYFRRHGKGDPVVADANTVMLFGADDVFRTSHVSLDGDECTVLSFDASVLAEASESDGEDFDAKRPFARGHALIDTRQLAASRLLFTGLARGHVSQLEAEERTLTLLRGVQRNSAPARGDRSRRARTLAVKAQELLAAKPQARLGLAELAGRLGTSPFHLSRTFHAVHGRSLHRYQTQLRLSRAIERIAGGASDMTALALDCGFSSHSHFTYVFKAATGTTPSTFRAQAHR